MFLTWSFLTCKTRQLPPYLNNNEMQMTRIRPWNLTRNVLIILQKVNKMRYAQNVKSRMKKLFETSYKLVKFIYFQKAIKYCKISTLLLSYVVSVESKVEISQNFVAFSEYINFISLNIFKNFAQFE